MSDRSEDERSVLARLEAELTADDPALEHRLREACGRLARRSVFAPWRRSSAWRAGASFADLLRPQPNEDELLVDPTGAVVVGCDGSPGGDAALRFAAAEARRRNSAMVVVIAFAEPIDPDNDDFDTPPAVQRERARAKAERAVDRAVRQPPRYQVVAMAGLPGRVLSERFPTAALVVIGARRKHALGPLTSGVSTERMLTTRGRVPMVVVPPTWPG